MYRYLDNILKKAYRAFSLQINDLELWCSWLSRLLYTQKVLGSSPSSSTFLFFIFAFQIFNHTTPFPSFYPKFTNSLI